VKSQLRTSTSTKRHDWLPKVNPQAGGIAQLPTKKLMSRVGMSGEIKINTVKSQMLSEFIEREIPLNALGVRHCPRLKEHQSDGVEVFWFEAGLRLHSIE